MWRYLKSGFLARVSSRKSQYATPSRSVVAINWFYEPYYQRIFPNRSFDRSPHYLLLDELPSEGQGGSLDAPFPPLSDGRKQPRRQPPPPKPQQQPQQQAPQTQAPQVRQHARPEPPPPANVPAAGRAAEPKFYARLRQRREADEL